MLLLIAFSLLAGLVTILAPCIWPILPVIFTTSIGKGSKRPLGISIGVIISFSLLTLFISYLVRLFHFDPNILRVIAVFVIAFLGLVLIIPALGTGMEILMTKISNIIGTKQTQSEGFWPGFITGITLGIIWTPCAGPILATIAVLSATSKVTINVIAITLAYSVGIGIPLFIISYGSQKLVQKTKSIGKFTPLIQKIFGIIMIITAIGIFFGYDQKLELKLLNAFPSLNQTLNSFEQNPSVTQELNKLKGTPAQLNANYPAPEITGITGWLNLPAGTAPPTISSLRGKVVLIDFWTYTCINCIRAIPHIEAWYENYKNYGFVAIGVHTPEFQFEHDINNVASAIKTDGITYPVAQDNNYATWNAYNNQFWPADYLIDSQGIVRRTDFGEGSYDQIEASIRQLLTQAGQTNLPRATSVSDQTPTQNLTPETYLGTNRFVPSSDLTIMGMWQSYPEYIQSGTNSAIDYNVFASKAYIILAPPATGAAKVKVFVDGTQTQELTVTSDKLYTIMDFSGSPATHKLELMFETPGTQAYTFTFGD